MGSLYRRRAREHGRSLKQLASCSALHQATVQRASRVRCVPLQPLSTERVANISSNTRRTLIWTHKGAHGRFVNRRPAGAGDADLMGGYIGRPGAKLFDPSDHR
jgi:hypothetical protein